MFNRFGTRFLEAIRDQASRLREQASASLSDAVVALREGRRDSPGRLAVEPVFALAVEAIRRELGYVPYDVQLLAGAHLVNERIAEMATGEGKTLTAALPLLYHALAGKGAVLVTANDYLAERDAKLLEPVFQSLGLSVGVVLSDTAEDDRAHAYRRDITYVTGNQLGFDYLRDRIRQVGNPDLNDRVTRPPYFVLVDEADNVLIDEASTPLVIGGVAPEVAVWRSDAFRWAAKHAGELERDTDFQFNERKKQIDLTEAGRNRVRHFARPPLLRDIGWTLLFEFMERAILVLLEYRADEQYAVREEEVVIVDPFTGRFGEGRRWQAGIHQAVEAKEGLPLSDDHGQAASITIQDLFLSFPKLAGMTGTAHPSEREFKSVYRRKVQVIPTRLPSQRVELPGQVFETLEEKWQAITLDVEEQLAAGRSVLIGTRTIDASEALSRQLTEREIEHTVLNARHLAREAEIVSQAGQPGVVTVATNMAGRGTDIQLHEQVRTAGGLHVILTEMHESRRIDRQLIGRCGRQGDPGSYRFLVSRQDELLETARRLLDRFATRIKPPKTLRDFRATQTAVDRRRLALRTAMLHQERKRLSQLKQSGLDPLLDGVG